MAIAIVVRVIVITVAIIAHTYTTIQIKSKFFLRGVGKGMCSAQLVGLGCAGSQLVPN